MGRGPDGRLQWWKWVLLACFAGPPIFIVWCNFFVFLVGYWGIEERAEALPETSAALILGAGPGSGAVQERLRAGIDLWQSGKVHYLLVSGGGDGTLYSESAYMERFLLREGVPPEVILVDPLGLRTLDSVKRARDVFGLRDVTIVTQRYHLYRSLFLARVAGMKVHGYVAQGGPEIDASGVRSREFFARVQAVVDTLTFRRARYPQELDIFGE